MKYKFSLYINFIFLGSFLLLGCNGKTSDSSKTDLVDKKEYTKFGIDEGSIASLKPIAVGTQAPDFSGKDQNDNEVQLSQLLQKGDVVLVFYRGYWCPLCSKHLGEFVGKLDAIKAKGATVVAVAPEGSKNIDKTVTETKLDIPFISDSDNVIMKKYGVAFKVNNDYNEKFTKWQEGLTIGEVNGQEEAYLPIPATYIIGENGKVKWVQYDPNYSNRSSVDDILSQL